MNAPRSFAQNAAVRCQKRLKINRKSLLVQNKISAGTLWQAESRDQVT